MKHERPEDPATPPVPARQPEMPEAALRMPDTERAVAESCQLLRYSQRNGVPIKEDWFEAIVTAREQFEAGELHGAALVKFHQTYYELACYLAPVTVKGIIDCVDEFGPLHRRWFFGKLQRISRASLAVGRYQLLAGAAVLLLLLVHSYWLIGARLTRTIEELDPKERQPAATATVSAPAPSPAPIGLGQDPTLPTIQIGVAPVLLPVIDLINAGNETKGDAITSQYQQLHRWLDYYDLPRSWLGSASNEEGGSTLNLTKNMAARYSAQDRIAILQTMILPLLYGFVGALAYVLREIGTDVQRRLFRTDLQVQYQLRAMLGAIGGLGVGWFVGQWTGQEKTVTVGSPLAGLTPAALAFLAGYSIEFFFSTMDNLVRAFASTSQPSKNQNRPLDK